MFFFHIFLPYCHFSEYSRAYLRGGGFKPPPEIFRFFLKSEGKEVGRKREKKNEKRWGGGGVNST